MRKQSVMLVGLLMLAGVGLYKQKPDFDRIQREKYPIEEKTETKPEVDANGWTEEKYLAWLEECINAEPRRSSGNKTNSIEMESLKDSYAKDPKQKRLQNKITKELKEVNVSLDKIIETIDQDKTISSKNTLSIIDKEQNKIRKNFNKILSLDYNANTNSIKNWLNSLNTKLDKNLTNIVAKSEIENGRNLIESINNALKGYVSTITTVIQK